MPEPLRASSGARISAGVLAACALAVLITGAWLRPEPSGMGSHQQLGLPPCGWLLASGWPCPTCGMTTAFAAVTHVQPRAAWLAQPFGAVLAVATTVFFWGGLHVAVFGSQLGRVLERLLAARVIWVVGAMLLASWAYKCWQVRTGGG